MNTKKGLAPVFMIIIVALVVGVAGGGYYFLTHKNGIVRTEDGRVVNYKQDNKQVEISDESGKLVIGEGVKLTEDFPKDIPVYPKAKITSVFDSKEGMVGSGLTQETVDGIDKIVSWYRDECKKQGWKLIGEDRLSEAMASVTFQKGTRIGGLSVIKVDDGTVTISFSTGESP